MTQQTPHQDDRGAQRAELLRRMLSGQQTPTPTTSITHRPGISRAPALPLQSSMWFVDQLNHSDAAYVMGTAVEFDGDIDPSTLREALGVLVERHTALRTTFTMEDGELNQVIHDHVDVDLTEASLPDDEPGTRRALRDTLLLPTPLDQLPVLRAFLWKGDGRCVIELKLHHANGDGTSMRVLIDELLRLLRGEELPAVPEVTQADVALWLTESDFSQQLQHWDDTLRVRGPLSFAHLPEDSTPGDQLSNVIEFDLPPHLSSTLAALTTKLHCTPFMTALASFQALLRLVTGRRDICVGTAMDRRLQWGLGPVIGCLVNTVALFDEVDLEVSFEQLVLKSRRTVSEAFSNADIPFEQVVHSFNEKQGTTPEAPCNVYLVDQPLSPTTPDGPRPVTMDPTGTQFDLVCHWLHSGDSIRVALVADPSACSTTGLKRLAEIWYQLLEQALRSPSTPLEELELDDSGCVAIEAVADNPLPVTPLPPPQMPETRSENRINSAACGQRVVLDWLDRLCEVESAVPAVVNIESWDTTSILPVILAAWHSGHSVQISTPVDDEPPRVYCGTREWLLAAPETGAGKARALDPDGGRPAWHWPDGSVLSHDELDSALEQLEQHLSNDLGVTPGSITLLGPATPLSTIALRLGLPVEQPRRGVRAEFAVGRATDIASSDPPPLTAVVTDAITVEFGQWAAQHDVTFCGAILFPGVGLFLSDTPGMLGSLRNGEAWVGSDRTQLPDNCPGSLQMRSRTGGTVSLPWLLTRQWYQERIVFGWVDHPVQPWPPVSTEEFTTLLGEPVSTAITPQGITEFVSTGRTPDLTAAARSLGLWTDLIHQLTPLENGGQAVIDTVLVDGLLSLTEDLGPEPTPLPLIKLSDTDVSFPRRDQPSIVTGRTSSIKPPFMTQFLNMSAEHPSRTAVILPDPEDLSSTRVSYQELAHRVSRQAQRLTEAGVRKDSIVAIQGGPDLDTLTSILAVSWCGAIWVPLDRTHPTSRRTQVLDVVNPDLVITDAGDEQWRWPVTSHAGDESRPPEAPSPTPSSPEDLAYVIFTSGSTGRPKGVKVSQRALSNLTDSIAELVGFTSDSVICWQTTPSFDISMVETIMPLSLGSTVVICPPEISRDPQLLSQVAVSHGITHIQASPRMWSSLMTTGMLPETVVRMAGGEPLPLPIAKQMATGDAWNLYGPTETTVWSSACHIVAPVDHVTIGAPLNNTIIAVVDDRGVPVPRGTIGEIVIGGVGVSPGYWNDDAATGQRFKAAPWASPGEVIYHTGDRGRLDPEGQLICLGRDDGQVKIHGYRVELGDIEQALEQDQNLARGLAHLVDETVCALVLPREDAAARRRRWQATFNWPWRDDVDGSPLGEEIVRTHLAGLSHLVSKHTGPVALIASDELRQHLGDLDQGQIVTGLDELTAAMETIIVLETDRRFADLEHLKSFCLQALDLVTPNGCLILTDLMSPSRHAGVHQLRSQAAGLSTPIVDPPWLLVDPDELLAALGCAGQLRPRLAATNLGEHRNDLLILKGEPTPPSKVVHWDERLSDPILFEQFLEDAPDGTALVGLPREMFRAPLLLQHANGRWRIHDDTTTLTLVAGPETPPRTTGNDPVPWDYRDPGMLAWEQAVLPGIKQAMAQRVPPYMVPSRLRAVSRFPVTLNDKVDRRAANAVWEKGSNETATSRQQVPEITFHEHFAAAVRAFPNQIALDGPEGVWTYQQLAQRVDALASRLHAAGLSIGSRVVVALPRSNQFITAVLAVSRLQGSFVPLDISQPAARNGLIITDSCADGAITDVENRHLVEHLPQVVDINDETPASTMASQGTGDPDAEAYVIFTSGTSGRPKGVRVAHRGIATILDLQRDRLETGPGHRVLQFAAPGFDAVVWELALSLLQGGTLVLRSTEALRPGPDLIRTLRADSITDIVLPPSTLAVLPPDESLPENLTIVAAGESLLPTLVDRYAPQVALFNAYGPTECTVATHMSQRLHVGDAPVIGEAAPGIEAYVLNDSGELVAPEQVGELHIGGRSLAIGYLNQPQRDAEAFIRPSFDPSLRLYRTGDLVTVDRNQVMTHRGRLDDQVKIRGYRVEPGEVEAVISSLPGVQQAVVVPLRDTEDSRLAAFVVGGGPSLSEELRNRLPSPMMPELHFRDVLPTNANGKVDRSALVATVPDDAIRSTPSGAEVGILVTGSAPTRIISHLADRHGRPVAVTRWTTPTPPGPHPRPKEIARLIRTADRNASPLGSQDHLACQIRHIWEDILNRPVPSDNLDFFTIGGHSLSAAHVVLQLREKGHDISVADFFAHPTITELHHLLAGERREVSDEELTTAAQLPPDIDPSACVGLHPEKDTASRTVMVTGATGFLGARLTLALLQRTTSTIHALVRGEDPDHATSRLHAAIDRFGIELNQEQRSRIRVIHGDLHAPQLGLDGPTMTELEETVDVIFHVGASVNLLDSFEHMIAPNVLGTTQMLRLATKGRLKHFHHISTIATLLGAARSGKAINEETVITPNEVIRTGYVMTKWVSEQLVSEARRRGLPATIHRLSRVAQDRVTGVHNPADAQLLFLAAAIQVGTYPDASSDFAASLNDAVCVDDLCDWIIALAFAKGPIRDHNHLVSSHCLTLGQIGDQLREAGFPLSSTTLEEWTRDLAHSASSGHHSTVQFSSDLRNMSAALPELGDYVVESANTQAALRHLGITPRAIDEDLMARHIQHLITTGFFPNPHLLDSQEHHD